MLADNIKWKKNHHIFCCCCCCFREKKCRSWNRKWPTLSWRDGQGNKNNTMTLNQSFVAVLVTVVIKCVQQLPTTSIFYFSVAFHMHVVVTFVANSSCWYSINGLWDLSLTLNKIKRNKRLKQQTCIEWSSFFSFCCCLIFFLLQKQIDTQETWRQF